MEELNPQFQQMVDNWDSPWVKHSQIKEFSFGTLARGSLANMCSEGKGPEFFYVNGRRVSTVEEMARWLQERSKRHQGRIHAWDSKKGRLRTFSSLDEVPEHCRFAVDKQTGEILRSITLEIDKEE